MSSRSDRATINFYTWESRGRGYYHFTKPIEIEPPFVPFKHIDVRSEYVDDGKVSLLGSIKKLLAPSKEHDEVQEIPEIRPFSIDTLPSLNCFEITFPQGTDISITLMKELLGLLHYSEASFSFEILAQNGSISVQFTSSVNDSSRLVSHIQAFFPSVIIQEKEALDIPFSLDETVAIADFGLHDEFMLPIANTDNLSIDPLTSIIATLGTLGKEDTAIFQVIFKGLIAPWSSEMQYSVSDGGNGSFFEHYPEFVSQTQDKVSNPLFSAVMRVGVQGKSDEHSRYIVQELARSITTISTSEHNKLILLSNEGYEYDDHLRNIFYRMSNRLGFIVNSKELAHFVHYPNKTVVNKKLGFDGKKTKKLNTNSHKGIYIGENIHQKHSFQVYIDTETRLSHTHILGSTGTGKSTLIANMMLEDIKQGRGCALFDPHGDICDDILKRIPEHRKDDVIIIDPSDIDFPIGFNLLEAKTEAERIVLSSDLVSAFKRHSTAWGDNMTAVLQNAINTILESSRGGTLIELKRFLIEDSFRNEYLNSVHDPSLHYYWNNEYSMVRKGIAPLLTRIDTFLRPKIIRYMLVQKKGVDIADCLNANKIVLLKLSQGLIGEHNSFLLGSLFLAKFNQSALARQSQSKERRTPYMLYLDEFQNFITPSIQSIISGARKYALGITIVHQELGQINDTSLLNSVLSNPKTRICFRLGDNDARKLASGFSYFEESDLQSLERGEAIMRIGSSTNDCNLSTNTLAETIYDYSQEIISSVRNTFSTPREEVEALLESMLPKIHQSKKPFSQKKEISKEITNTKIKDSSQTVSDIVTTTNFEEKKESIIEQAEKQEQVENHRTIQNYIKKVASVRGYKTTIEKELSDKKRIDVVIENQHHSIAFEISHTNSVDYEVKNIQKCLTQSYTHICCVCDNEKHLGHIKERLFETNSDEELGKVHFLNPSQIISFLDSFEEPKKPSVKRVRGYRVSTQQIDITDVQQSEKSSGLRDAILKSIKKSKGK